MSTYNSLPHFKNVTNGRFYAWKFVEWWRFRCEIGLFIIHVAKWLSDFYSVRPAGNLAHFPNLKEVDRTQSTAAEKGTEYAQIITDLQEEFRRRFQDFRSSEDAITLFAQPFSVQADTAPEELQMQLIELQCDSWLKQKFDKVPLNEFYKFASSKKYPGIRKHAQKMLSLFGSTYICEQTFSILNLNKSRLRERLSDPHLLDVLRMSVSQLQPDVDKLLHAKNQYHVSHWLVGCLIFLFMLLVAG